ncbi:MAG: glutamyl-tRNA reductase [Polyangiaceae bacterium]
MIVVVGLSHKGTPIDVRERLAMGKDELCEAMRRLRKNPNIGEVAILSTCNRVEVFAAPAPARRASDGAEPEGAQLIGAERAVYGELCAIGGSPVERHLRGLRGRDALRHLFRVAASLDSLVVGEPQILGQLKDAITLAEKARTIGGPLSAAMNRAVRVGKRVRTDTEIGSGQVSVSSVAVELAQQIFGDLHGHRALLIGAGDMAEAASRLVVRAGASLTIVNRSPDRAAALAAEVGGTPRPWGELESSIADTDIVISSTSSPAHVVTYDLVKSVRKARRGRSLFFIDIAVPRDIDPAVNKLDGVYLYDVDDLSQIVAQSLAGRAAEAGRAAGIVDEEVQSFEKWIRARAMSPVVVGLRERTRATLFAELEKSLAGKLRHLGDPERAALTAMLEAATNKLLHTPTTRLRELAGDPRGAEYVEALCSLFELSTTTTEATHDAGEDVPAPHNDPARSQLRH